MSAYIVQIAAYVIAYLGWIRWLILDT